MAQSPAQHSKVGGPSVLSCRVSAGRWCGVFIGSAWPLLLSSANRLIAFVHPSSGQSLLLLRPSLTLTLSCLHTNRQNILYVHALRHSRHVQVRHAALPVLFPALPPRFRLRPPDCYSRCLRSSRHEPSYWHRLDSRFPAERHLVSIPLRSLTASCGSWRLMPMCMQGHLRRPRQHHQQAGASCSC